MSSTTAIRWLEQVECPFEDVRTVLSEHTDEIFHLSTTQLETRADQFATELHGKIAGIELRKDIVIDVLKVTDASAGEKQKMVVELAWKAAGAESLFPAMVAELHVSPIKGHHTQLDFRGEYVPPLGFARQIHRRRRRAFTRRKVRAPFYRRAGYIDRHAGGNGP